MMRGALAARDCGEGIDGDVRWFLDTALRASDGDGARHLELFDEVKAILSFTTGADVAVAGGLVEVQAAAADWAVNDFRFPTRQLLTPCIDDRSGFDKLRLDGLDVVGVFFSGLQRRARPTGTVFERIG
jgi:hypothetical protein